MAPVYIFAHLDRNTGHGYCCKNGIAILSAPPHKHKEANYAVPKRVYNDTVSKLVSMDHLARTERHIVNITFVILPLILNDILIVF